MTIGTLERLSSGFGVDLRRLLDNGGLSVVYALFVD